MRLTRVYTRTGDDGTTSLATGERLPKDHIRIESYGTVDELNSVLALCLTHLENLSEEYKILIQNIIIATQNDLFNLGSDLATPIQNRFKNMKIISENEIIKIENTIDLLQKKLAPLSEFVLPGGGKLNAFFHLARTVCRRAERTVISFSKMDEINPSAVKFLNRLSDLLFVLSRFVQIESGLPENTWKKDKGFSNLEL